MTTTITEMTVRKKTPRFDVIWYDGRNAVDVARWLVDRDKKATVELTAFGEKLILNGRKVEIPREGTEPGRGGWIDLDFNCWTDAALRETHDVIEAR